MTETKPDIYRDLIDALVKVCRSGQGQVGADRARRGVWNPHVAEDGDADQHALNLLLQKLSLSERDALARALEHAFEDGVFETLKALEEAQIPPFQDGYEGSPYHDFVGRLGGDWEWPQQR